MWKDWFFRLCALIQTLQSLLIVKWKQKQHMQPLKGNNLCFEFYFFLQHFKLKFTIHCLSITWMDSIINLQNVNSSSGFLTDLEIETHQRCVSDSDLYNLTFFWRTLTLRSFTSNMSLRSWISPAWVPFSSAISWICFVFLFSIVSFSSRRNRKAST